MLGLDVEQVATEVSRAGKIKIDEDARSERGDRNDRNGRDPRDRRDDGEPSPTEAAGAMPMPDRRDPVVLAERQLLQVLLQFPTVFKPGAIDLLTPESFSAPAHRAVFDGIRIAHHSGDKGNARAWTSAVTEAAPSPVAGLVSELAVDTLPTRMDPNTGLPTSRYVDELFDRVRTIALTRRIADSMSEMRRLDHAETPEPERTRELGIQLQTLQRELAAIKAGMG
jgi:DNA primase